MKNETVLYGTDEAAEWRTGISGWVDRKGMFWGNDEHMARYSGCTHTECKGCGRPVEKMYTRCQKCREIKSILKYHERAKAVWSGEPLYSDSHDKFFFSEDDLTDYMYEEGVGSTDDLRLIICVPISLSQVDHDYWADDLPEDGELPPDVEAALEALNDAIRQAVPCSYEPGKYAADMRNFKT